MGKGLWFPRGGGTVGTPGGPQGGGENRRLRGEAKPSRQAFAGSGCHPPGLDFRVGETSWTQEKEEDHAARDQQDPGWAGRHGVRGALPLAPAGNPDRPVPGAGSRPRGDNGGPGLPGGEGAPPHPHPPGPDGSQVPGRDPGRHPVPGGTQRPALRGGPEGHGPRAGRGGGRLASPPEPGRLRTPETGPRPRAGHGGDGWSAPWGERRSG